MKLQIFIISAIIHFTFASKISIAQIDSNRYDMVDSNMTFLDIPSSGTFEEVYNISSYTTPFVVEYSGSSQNSSNSLFSTASSHYNPAGNVSNIYAAGPHWGTSGLYTTKLYNLKTHSITFKGRFYNRYGSSGGEYNEYWFGFVPPNNKYYHPIVTEAGGDKPVGYLIGGWPTFWVGRNRGTDNQSDNFFTSNINTSLNWAKWIEVSMKIWVSNDSIFIKKYSAKESGSSNSYSITQPIYAGKLSALSYAENARLVFCTDDMLDWVEIITEPYSTNCNFTISKLPSPCEFDGTIVNIKEYLLLNGKSLLNSDFITLVEDCPLNSGLKNSNLLNNQFSSNFPAGNYKFKIFTNCGSDTFSLNIQQKPKLICAISDSTLCINNSKVLLNGKTSNYLNSAMTYEWNYFDQNNKKQLKTGSTVNADLSIKTTKNQIIVTGKTISGCTDSSVLDYRIIDTSKVNFKIKDDCLGNSQFFEIIDANINKFKSTLWSFGDGTIKNQFSFTKTMSNSGQHAVQIILIDSNDCTSHYKVNFQTFKLPKANFTITLNTIGLSQKELILETIKNDSLNHTWKYTNGKPIGNQLFIKDTINNSDKYCFRLVVEDLNKCRDSTEKCVYVTITDLEEYYIPNAFTPRKSTINNVFKPYFSHELIEYKILIINRWGEEIFKSNNQHEYWDATFMGKAVPDGNYIYILQGQFPSKRVINEKGVIYVLD